MINAALTTQPQGQYSLPLFYNTFLQPELDSAVAARVNAAEQMRDFFRCASTQNNANQNILRVGLITEANPLRVQSLRRHAQQVQQAALSRLGLGGPGLTTAAFNQGIVTLRDTMDENARQGRELERSKLTKTFTERHGDTLAQRMYNLTGAANDAGLPDIHGVLAKSTVKGRDYSILQAAVLQRANASPVPLTSQGAPIVTTKIMDEVFRSFQPGGTGLVFARGLTPFGVVCEGHKEMDLVRRTTKQAEIAETGGHLSLTDAEKMTTTDVRLASDPSVAAQKLYGWSIYIDLFHGNNHDISVAIRSFVAVVGPILPQIASLCASTTSQGMDLVNRVLYEAQQEYFMYVNSRAMGQDPAVPTFTDIKNKVLSYRASSLSPMPTSWYTMIDSAYRPDDSPTGKGQGPRERAGAVATVNASADNRLLQRFKDSGHRTISSMTEGHEVEIPKHAGKEVCLVWALKGECSATCKRKAQHVDYSRNTVRDIHNLLSKCGVANPQE